MRELIKEYVTQMKVSQLVPEKNKSKFGWLRSLKIQKLSSAN